MSVVFLKGSWTSLHSKLAPVWELIQIKSEIKVPAGLVSDETSLSGLEMAVFSVCPHMVFPLCKLGERLLVCL